MARWVWVERRGFSSYTTQVVRTSACPMQLPSPSGGLEEESPGLCTKHTIKVIHPLATLLARGPTSHTPLLERCWRAPHLAALSPSWLNWAITSCQLAASSSRADLLNSLSAKAEGLARVFTCPKFCTEGQKKEDQGLLLMGGGCMRGLWRC